MGDDAQEKQTSSGTDELADRVNELERLLGEISTELRTGRLVVLDARDRERLVAEVVGEVLELRLDLPSSDGGGRSAVLAFTSPADDQLGAGLGLQLWAAGELVEEICWWADEARPRT